MFTKNSYNFRGVIKSQNYFILILTLIFSISIFAESVSTIESVKKRDRAEMNIEVTKIKTESITALHMPNQKKIILNLSEQEEKNPKMQLFLLENLDNLFKYSTNKNLENLNRNILNNRNLRAGNSVHEGNLSYKFLENKRILEITYENEIQNIFVGISDENSGEIEKLYKTVLIDTYSTTNNNLNLAVDSNYLGAWIQVSPTVRTTGNITYGTDAPLVLTGGNSAVGTAVVTASNDGSQKVSIQYRYSGGVLQISLPANSYSDSYIFTLKYTDTSGNITNYTITLYVRVVPEFQITQQNYGLNITDNGSNLFGIQNIGESIIANVNYKQLMLANTIVAKDSNYFPVISTGFYFNSPRTLTTIDESLYYATFKNSANDSINVNLYWKITQKIGDLLSVETSSGLKKVIGAFVNGGLDSITADLATYFDHNQLITLSRSHPARDVIYLNSDQYQITYLFSSYTSIGNLYLIPDSAYSFMSGKNPYESRAYPPITVSKDQQLNNGISLTFNSSYRGTSPTTFDSSGNITGNSQGININNGDGPFLAGLPYKNYLFVNGNSQSSPYFTFDSTGSGTVPLILEGSGADALTLKMNYSNGVLTGLQLLNWDSSKKSGKYTFTFEHKDGSTYDFYTRRLYTFTIDLHAFNNSFSFSTEPLDFGTILKGNSQDAAATAKIMIKNEFPDDKTSISLSLPSDEVTLSNADSSSTLTASELAIVPISPPDSTDYTSQYNLSGVIKKENFSATSSISEGTYTGNVVLNINIGVESVY